MPFFKPKKAGAAGPNIKKLEKVIAESGQLESTILVDLPQGRQVKLVFDAQSPSMIVTVAVHPDGVKQSYARSLGQAMIDIGSNWTKGTILLTSVTCKSYKASLNQNDLKVLAAAAWCEALGAAVPSSDELAQKLPSYNSPTSSHNAVMLQELANRFEPPLVEAVVSEKPHAQPNPKLDQQQSLMSVAEAWNVIHEWLDKNAHAVKSLLNKPAEIEAFTDLEHKIGIRLPNDFRESYMIHNGSESCAGPIVGIPLMSLTQVETHWRQLQATTQRNVLNAELSCPSGMIKEVIHSRMWIPFAGPDEDNFIAIDFDPGPTGTVGQVISFGNDSFIYGTNRFVIAKSFSGFMNFLANLFLKNAVEISDDQRFLQMVRRRQDGNTCNILTGMSMLLDEIS